MDKKNERKKYKKSPNDAGVSGTDYQINLLALIALKGLNYKGHWEMSTENESSGKFDDIVFESRNGDYLLQCKHKKNKKSILGDDLFFTKRDDDFHLQKYSKSFETFKKKFDTKLVIICSNIGPDENDQVVQDHFEKQLISNPLFPMEILSYKLRESKKNDSELKKVFQASDDFWKKFRFFRVIDSEIDKSINDELSNVQRTFGLEFDRKHFIENMREWFKDKNGYFIKKQLVKAFLYDWRSQNYWAKLNSFNIYFDKSYFVRKKIKLLNVITVDDDFLLHILMIRRSLSVADSTDKKQILCISPEEVSDKLIECFELPRFSILIIPINDLDQNNKIYGQIEHILTKYPYKKAIIFSNKKIHSTLPETAVIGQKINFTDLTTACQNDLLSKSIDYQGKDMTIGMVIMDSEDNIDSIIDQRTTIDLILNKHFKIGTVIRDLEDIKQYYIDREFTQKNQDATDELKEKDVCCLVKESGKFVLISDGAGMGKTTILTRLGWLIKETYPSLYLIRVDLNKFTGIFKKFQKANKESIGLEDILKSNDRNYHMSNFERNIFSMTNKIILMVDAVDEISPTYTSLVQNFLLETSKRRNISKIFVTTRPHLTTDLESFLGIKSFRLLPYSRPEQIDFLKRYWVMNLHIDNDEWRTKCELYAEKLIGRITIAIGYTSWNFIGIPLQTRMIAEIFQGSDGKSSEWVCCKDFLISDNELLELPDKLNISKLYDMFIEKKGEIFIDDKCNIQGNVASEEIITKHYEDSINEHKKLAARLLFKESECALLNIFKFGNNSSRATILKMGILQDMEDELLFVHQTFAEYFVAKTMWEQLDDVKVSKKFLVFLLTNVFLRKEYEVIRAFSECILINQFDRIRDEVFEVCGSTVDSIVWNENKNINILGKEGRMHILKLILERSENSRNIFEHDTDLKTSCWRSILIRMWLRIKKRKKLLNIVDKSTGKTILSTSMKSQGILEYLLDKGADINQTDRFGRTILHYAVEETKTDLVRVLVERGAIINTPEDNTRNVLTPLIWSIYKKSSEIFDILIENGADVNATSDQNTPLIYTMYSQHFEMAKKLIEEGANIHTRNKHGETALHWAAVGNDEILIYLIQKGAKVNEQDNLGYTPAHFAVRVRQLDCLKILVAHGATTNIRTKNGPSVLEFATTLGYADIVDTLSTVI